MESKDYKNLELNLGKGCNNRCVFCLSGKIENPRHHTPIPLDDAKREIERYYDQGCRSLGFLGGEPTIYPHILEVISFAKDKGYKRIALTTNGRLCDDLNFCLKLIKSGVNRFNISIHSHDAKIEDKITRVPGNFKRKVKALKNLVALKKEGLIPYGVSINAVVNKNNYKNLPKFVIFFKDIGIRDIRFNFIRLEGLAKEDVRSSISLQSFKPFVKKLVDLNEKKFKINLNFGEMPLCIYSDLFKAKNSDYLVDKYVGEFLDLSTEVSLKDYERSYIKGKGKDIIIDQVKEKRFNFQDEKRNNFKKKLLSCKKCSVDSICEGIWKNYLAVYKNNEIFKPIIGVKKRSDIEDNLPYHLLRVGLACNVECVFCNIPAESGLYPVSLSLTEIIKKADEIFKKDSRPKISITGGEPTIRKDLVEIVKYLKKKGAKTIEVQTNAIMLADNTLVQRLKRAGISKAFVSFHSHLQKMHDLLILRKGGFEKCIQGIKNLVDNNVEVILNPVVNSLTYRSLPDYIDFVHKNFPKINCISLSVVQPNQRAMKNNKVIPRYGAISPFIEKALNLADRHNIVVNNPNCGLPFCIGGWHKRLDRCLDYNESLALKKNLKSTHPKQLNDKIKSESCRECELNEFCSGVWRGYAELHPLTDLKPIKQ